MSRQAHLFLDETGSFSPSHDDMRIVGGLLLVAEGDVHREMEQIHRQISTSIAWPVRMHARELVDNTAVLRWHALGAAAQRKFLQPAEIVALDLALAEHPQPTPHHDGGTWSTIGSVQRTSKHRPVLLQVGSRLLKSSQRLLGDSFRGWCTEEKSAFMIAGHVDDAVPGGAQAYDAAFDQAVSLAIRVANKAGVSALKVEVAAPGVQTSVEIQRRAARLGIHDVSVVQYDQGSHALWLADSFLAWMRPLPRSVVGSALHPRTGVRPCLRAASSKQLSRSALLETAFDYFIDAVLETEAL